MMSPFHLLILTVCAFMAPHLTSGQSILRSAIGSSGGEGILENTRLTWTLGEANAYHQSFLSGAGFITAGFHQPDLTDRLEAGEAILTTVAQNPFTGVLQSYLYAPSGSLLTMYLFDTQGRCVATKENLYSGAVRWNLENLPNGIYFLGVGRRGSEVEHTRKVIKTQ